MLKKGLLILVGVALTVGVLGAAGFVYAQTQDTPFFAGKGNDLGGFGTPGFGKGDGPLSEYMLPALADEFDFTAEQVAAFELAQETMAGVREDFTSEEIREKMKTATTAAVDSAVADGALTQEEADKILERLENSDRGGRGGRGKRGGKGQQDGALQEYVKPAMADALGFTLEEFEALHEDGDFNLKEYAEEQGWTDEEIQEMMKTVFSDAVAAALADGTITQEQADKMLEKIENADGKLPFGRGGRRGGSKNGN